MKRSALGLCLLFAVACGSERDPPPGGNTGRDGGTTDGSIADTGPAPDGGNNNPDAMACNPAPGARTLSGTEIVTHVLEDLSTTDRPADLTTRGFAALVRTPENCFATYPAMTTAQGTFTVPNLPAGQYYLRTNQTPPIFFISSADEVDLGYDVQGRPDVTEAAATTTVRLNITGLSSWQSFDDMELFSRGANAFVFAVPFLVEAAPEIGATTLQGTFTYDLGQVFDPNLIEGSKGDTAMITQLVTSTAPASMENYAALGKVLQLPSFTMADGQETTLSGAMTDVPRTNNLMVSWRRSAYSALGAAMHPRAVLAENSLYIASEPAVDRGQIGATADLVEMFTTAMTDFTDTISFGNPFPNTFTTVATAQVRFRVPITIAGAMPLRISLNAFTNLVPPGNSVSLAPTLTPVRGLQIAGRAANVDLSGVGTTPEIRWEAPATGAATSYTAQIREAYAEQNLTRSRFIASFNLAGTSINVPAGILESGKSYFVLIFTDADPTAPMFERNPFRRRYPNSTATAMSELFTP